MKWKRSKKAQQEAKEKKSSSSSSSGSSSSVSTSSSSSTSTQAAISVPSTTGNSANLAPIQSINGGPINEHIVSNKSTADKMLDANLLLSNANGFHQPKTMTNLEQHHRHIVNLSSNLSEYNSNISIEESMQAAAKLNRRPMIFADGNQDIHFRPYVV